MIALAVLAALAAALGTLRWTIPAGWSEARLQKALARTTGYRLSGSDRRNSRRCPGRRSMSPGWCWRDPTAGGAGAGRARQGAHERLLVAGGRTALVELTLFDPQIDLLPDADAGTPRPGDAAISAAIIDLLGRDRRHELRSLRIERGTLRFGTETWMSNLALKLTGGVNSDLRLSATGLHLGQPLLVQLTSRR